MQRKAVSLLARSGARLEGFLKGVAFDCRACGQCLLSRTGLICPMSCPKGLRNGPCGGTLGEHCEVHSDRECVWVRIHRRTRGRTAGVAPLNRSADAALAFTSSFVNSREGYGFAATKPLDYLPLPACRVGQPVATASRLEQALKSGRFVFTCEIRSPRGGDFTHLRKELDFVRGCFDAVNATAYLNGKPSLPSARACIELLHNGVDPICQSTCRDHTKTSFVSLLIDNHANGIHNHLCLTGDSYAGSPCIKQVFDMDSALMIYEARHLRETGRIHFTDQLVDDAPRPFIGAAINPFTRPLDLVMSRLRQKVAAGADFVQTQAVFDTTAFAEFMHGFCAAGLDRECFLLAGIPVVVSRRALETIPGIPGVRCGDDVRRRLGEAGNIREEGILLAIETIRAVSAMPGVRGVHLMLFGADRSVLPRIRSGIGGPGSAGANFGATTASGNGRMEHR